MEDVEGSLRDVWLIEGEDCLISPKEELQDVFVTLFNTGDWISIDIPESRDPTLPRWPVEDKLLLLVPLLFPVKEIYATPHLNSSIQNC